MAETQQLIEDFIGMTGTDQSTAESYLEMSGNDLESAIQLFFGSSELGADSIDSFVSSSSSSKTTISSSSLYDDEKQWSQFIFDDGKVPLAWLEQGLQFETETETESDNLTKLWKGLSLVQFKNGPCGVLAVVQASV